MKKSFVLFNAFLVLALVFVSSGSITSADPTPGTITETIVLIRHGEKPPHGLGQLSCRGLNRSLALPDVLIGKYGTPDYIFAPNPSVKIDGGKNAPGYSYVRPLATIEPTAIRLVMPVNTQIGYDNIQQLQSELTKPEYARSLIFVAWEHGYLDLFAQNVMKAYGDGATVVPGWPGDDYDSIFVIRLQHSGDKTTATFTADHEGLNDKLSSVCPVAAGS